MRLTQLVLAMMAAFVVAVALFQSTAVAALSSQDANENHEMGHSEQQAAVRANFMLPALFDFDNYKRLFKKRYSSIAENMVRFKLFTSRAMRAVVSGIKYRFRQARYHFAVNHLSDASPEELDRMRNRVLEAERERSNSTVVPSASSDELSLLDFIPDDDENVLEILRKAIEEHRGEPGFDELRAQLVKVEQARGQSRRRKRDVSGAAEVTPRELTLEKLISLPVSESDLLSPETRAKIRVHPASNNPEYRGHEPMTEGLYDQQLDLPDVTPRISAPIQESLSKALNKLRLKYFSVGSGSTQSSSESADEVFLDLRKESNCFFAPRNQGHCGSCYAFAATTVAEWLHCNTTGELVPFSEQYVIDCGAQYSDDMLKGCGGGRIDFVSRFFSNFGWELRSNYPYQAANRECPYAQDTDLETTGYIRGDLRKSVRFNMPYWPDVLRYHGPLAVNIDTSGGFNEYGSGVFDGCKPVGGTHSVVLIGHGREDGEEYWLIRNSYSAGWGDGGHIKISKKADCIQPRAGWTFGSDDGRVLSLKTRVNKANDGKVVKARYLKKLAY